MIYLSTEELLKGNEGESRPTPLLEGQTSKYRKSRSTLSRHGKKTSLTTSTSNRRFTSTASNRKSTSTTFDSLEFMHIEISTLPGAFNEGRTYFLEAEAVTAAEWVVAIKGAVKKNISQLTLELKAIERFRIVIRDFYYSPPVTFFFMLLIALNFFAGVLESEFLPEPGSGLLKIFQMLDYSFVTIFTVELGLNLISNWYYDFVDDRWNLFDLLVVLGDFCLYIIPK